MSIKPLLQASQGLRPSRYPIWFLRQAGRYLPEYRELRAQHEFLALCKQPRLAAEVSLQPLRRFDLDASIIFSDILIPAVVAGQELTFQKDHGPVLSKPVRDAASLKALHLGTERQDWDFVGEAISLVKSQLAPHQTMIGFAGAPFTLASYMIEGQGGTNFSETKKLAFLQPALFRDFLSQLAHMTVAYLRMQLRAGAEVLMLFDTWAQQLMSEDFRSLVQESTQSLIREISKEAPVIYYAGQGSDRLYDLEGTQASVIAVDWRTPLHRAQSILRSQGLDLCLQGNIDPLCLLGTEDFVRARVRALMEEVQESGVKAHIFNVGHGLTPPTPISAVEWVIDEVRRFKFPNSSHQFA